MIDVILVWLALFGVWPLSHPDHDITSIMSAFDIMLHLVGVFGLVYRWKIVRREVKWQ